MIRRVHQVRVIDFLDQVIHSCGLSTISKQFIFRRLLLLNKFQNFSTNGNARANKLNLQFRFCSSLANENKRNREVDAHHSLPRKSLKIFRIYDAEVSRILKHAEIISQHAHLRRTCIHQYYKTTLRIEMCSQSVL